MTIHAGTSAASTVSQTVQTVSGAAYLQQLLFVIRSADMAVTTDQAFTKVFSGTKYQITAVSGVLKTGAFNTACAGGIYTAASKGGTPVVAAAQSWANLTAAGKMVAATIAAVNGTDVQSATPLYLALSTANSAALTADCFIFGVALD